MQPLGKFYKRKISYSNTNPNSATQLGIAKTIAEEWKQAPITNNIINSRVRNHFILPLTENNMPINFYRRQDDYPRPVANFSRCLR